MSTLFATGEVDGFIGREVLAGIHSVMAEKGWLFRRIAVEYIQSAMGEIRPDAIIVINDCTRIPNRILESGPMIFTGDDRTPAGIASVVPDDVGAGRMCGEHFLARGIRSLASFGYGHDHPETPAGWERRRIGGMRQAALSAGARYTEFGERIDPATGAAERGTAENIVRWLRELPKPVGVMAASDPWAETLAFHCVGARLRVPEDVGIIGMGNDQLMCEMCVPPLSSVMLSWRRIGREAAILAEKMIQQGHIPRGPLVVPSPGIRTRRSSDVLAIDDPDVAAAMAIIHAHARKPLTVAQILKKVPAFQHRLERSFKALVGRRMTQEIRRIHVEQAKHLLVTTDLPMPDIARKSGFSNSKQLATAFYSETGMTPSAFRRRH